MKYFNLFGDNMGKYRKGTKVDVVDRTGVVFSGKINSDSFKVKNNKSKYVLIKTGTKIRSAKLKDLKKK